MKFNPHCRWTRHRLPLLAGGELAPDERRKVERHLIVCGDCRDRRDASTEALSALRRLAEEPATSSDAPSLWPALADQIRRSRHAAPRPSWSWRDVPLPRPWAFAGAMTGLVAVLAASIARTPGPESEPASSPPWIVAQAPAAGPIVASTPEPDPLPTSPRGALPETPARSTIRGLANVKPIEPPSSSLQFDYDLDHGTPMPLGNSDPQRTF